MYQAFSQLKVIIIIIIIIIIITTTTTTTIIIIIILVFSSFYAFSTSTSIIQEKDKELLNNKRTFREGDNLFSAVFCDDIMKTSILKHLGCHINSR
jgi:ABC-type dipeptide/oligopeptide/nickel transport system permease subunit